MQLAFMASPLIPVQIPIPVADTAVELCTLVTSRVSQRSGQSGSIKKCTMTGQPHKASQTVSKTLKTGSLKTRVSRSRGRFVAGSQSSRETKSFM